MMPRIYFVLTIGVLLSLTLAITCPTAVAQCSRGGGESGAGFPGGGGFAGAGFAGNGMLAGNAGNAFTLSQNPQVFAMAMQQLQRQNQILQQRLMMMQQQMAGYQQQNRQLLAQLQQLESSGTDERIAGTDKVQKPDAVRNQLVGRFAAGRQSPQNRPQ